MATIFKWSLLLALSSHMYFNFCTGHLWGQWYKAREHLRHNHIRLCVWCLYGVKPLIPLALVLYWHWKRKWPVCECGKIWKVRQDIKYKTHKWPCGCAYTPFFLSFCVFEIDGEVEGVGCRKLAGRLLGGTATRGGVDSWLVIAACSN